MTLNLEYDINIKQIFFKKLIENVILFVVLQYLRQVRVVLI